MSTQICQIRVYRLFPVDRCVRYTFAYESREVHV